MNSAKTLAAWVAKKPILLIRFDDDYSEGLANSTRGLEYVSLTKTHSAFEKLKVPTLCLLETTSYKGTKCYLGTIKRKTAASTFESRITVRKLREIAPASLTDLEHTVTDKQLKGILNRRLPEDGELQVLSPKLSSHLIELLAENPRNQSALDTAVAMLPDLRNRSDPHWAQDNAIRIALQAFGIRNGEMPVSVSLKQGHFSGLSLLGSHLYEDNVVRADGSHIPGFEAVAPDVTGRAEFQKGGEKLVIYTANKLPLETAFGVDLIYINDTRGSIVMLQYKMLEPHQASDGASDWRFRPDGQLRDEIARMRLPGLQGTTVGYRLHRSPYFFKFVKRKVVNDSCQSFILSLDHLQQVLANPSDVGAVGPRDGVRISFNALDGTYLREQDFIGLIRSGYIGTFRSETQYLQEIIQAIAAGNKAVVLAWQSKIVERSREANEFSGDISERNEESQ